jgi:sigma-E factor negative regulatory protein RseA
MTKELSALFDGELEVHEEPALWVTLKRNPQLRGTWQDYKLIGDTLRAEGNLARDITADVMRDLYDEPVILVPKPKPARRWSSVVMAMAASVAGIAVVGWLALSQPMLNSEPATLAQQAAKPSVPPLAAAPAPSQGMQEYMLAHQANAPGLYLQGGTQHIRTVSVVGPAK